MSIEIIRASSLGSVYKLLNLDPDTRISVQVIGATEMHVWDLSNGDYYVFSLSAPLSNLKTHVEVPQWVTDIIAMSSDELLAIWNDWEHEDDLPKLMAVQSELTFRGISTLRGR